MILGYQLRLHLPKLENFSSPITSQALIKQNVSENKAKKKLMQITVQSEQKQTKKNRI